MTAAATRGLNRLGRTPDWVIDAALGTLVVLAGLLSTADGDTSLDGTYRDRDAVAVVLVLAATVPYYVRRRAPFVVFASTSAAVGTLMLLDYNPGALPWTLLIGAYTVGAYCSARHLAAGAVAIGATLIVLLVGDTPAFGAGEALSAAIPFAGAMILGQSMKARRLRIDAFDREQEQAALRAAADERLRIAQELHDVVAHSLGVIAVQAGVGMHVIDSDPAEARRLLEHISQTSRSSLAEIRRLLGMVRNVEGTPTYTPAPGLADLERLAAEVTAAGLPVDVSVEGEIDDIPAGLSLAAYRIVQEALTNALRHAGARHANVQLSSTEGQLTIEVLDDGRGPNGTAPSGHGLVGMRERVALYGGSLSAGPGVDGGFRVAARLPYDREPVT